jgi:MFS transporter, PAT family, beta-lactamase induction signal transducer AmpG
MTLLVLLDRPQIFYNPVKPTRNYPKLTSLLLLGFASGLPYFLTGKTLQLWMFDAKIDIGAITLFSLVGLPYSLKFIWSPLLDRFVPPFLGLRRGWLFLTQLGLAGAIASMAWQNPAQNTQILQFLAINCMIIAFLSATQDIAGDAYRTDVLAPKELEIGASIWVWGYRGAAFFAIALAPILADRLPWNTVYLIMAGLMAFSIFVTISAKEPARNNSRSGSLSPIDLAILTAIVLLVGWLLWWVVSDPCLDPSLKCTPLQTRLVSKVYWILAGILAIWIGFSFFAPIKNNNNVEGRAPETLKDAIILPFQEFLHRFGLIKACTVLVFILLYKLGDSLVATSANVFLKSIGFTNTEIGAVTGFFGFIATTVGLLAGGAIMTKLGINRSLWIFGILQVLSNFGYYALSLIGKDSSMLVIAINIENFCSGLVTVVTVAYMMSLCNHNFTTTQFALFSSLMAIGRDVLSAPAGELAKATGWPNFFILSVFAALPGLFLLPLVAPWKPKTPAIPRLGSDN